ncbi:MAG: GntR family transcriptional regulator [Actinobacteria bacterium]|nr:GntR family transcriptional regulator [Actinomycetota bacterium]NIS37005.1 GntR family transcriptional regulator [Actinomycetota bacterium]NIT99021.1 GntR family transcriptional regulator [Actinomycetota bacterium]NIU22646.1 GntR family transcriptional regulator [Actinomycetota bacterium]NIU71467.1 GntR family transcriptional regulator [Actinomycetota bacterium]
MRTPRYQQIADDLRVRIAEGGYTAGRLLPSEADLSREFGVSRVTVRRALEQLREAGLIDARQGLGWFAASEPVRQPLTRLDTIEDQLAASGAVPERRVLDFAFVDAPDRIAAQLGEQRVLEVRRVNLADGRPFARVTVWCPETLGERLSRQDVEAHPFYELLEVRIQGAEQTIGAAAAGRDDADLLDVPEGSPVLVCERITRAADGRAVLVSEHVYPGHLTVFSAELPGAGTGEAPAGLRLVE